jgi:tripartite motif-containing protein 2/3
MSSERECCSVAVNRLTGDMIVTERSPTHQIQVYNQYGQFVRKFGANILQHPRGVCVDHRGRVVVVECKVLSCARHTCTHK